eukprot:11167626-Lingulodinium_polyedra.AAC.1
MPRQHPCLPPEPIPHLAPRGSNMRPGSAVPRTIRRAKARRGHWPPLLVRRRSRLGLPGHPRGSGH